MQLTIEVLPAPLGPMIENNSPSLTPKLTSVSARTPPKRSDTPRTSRACSTHSLRWRRFPVRICVSRSNGVCTLSFLRLLHWASRPYPAGAARHIQLWGTDPPRFWPWQKALLHILDLSAAQAVRLPATPG